MSGTFLTYEQGYTGFSPRIERIVTSATLAQVTAAGWLNYIIAEGAQIAVVDKLCIAHDQGSSSAATDFFNISVANGIYTLTLTDAGAVLPTVAGNIAIFYNTAGIVTENIAGLNNVPNSSATPGTVRSLWSEITSSATTMTSGNLVGVRGSITYVGASGGFLYGVQGKLIASGTISGSSWNAGVFGQLDISAATINAGQMAPIWGDYGATSGTLTNQTGLYGIAMTNTTAAVLAGQLYLYGGATNLMLLNTNAGLSGTTYFKAAGTSSGSAGYASGCNATEVLQISVNGTTYYLPCFAQNS